MNFDNFAPRTNFFHAFPARQGTCNRRAHGGSFDMMIVPLAANMPSTPWQTEIRAPGIWAGADPRIWRTLSFKAYMPYMPACMYERSSPLVLSGSLPPGQYYARR
ncbi:MAG: hypothetical protein WA709_02130 [Stellaceae bacterium]